jgi:putative membrane protein
MKRFIKVVALSVAFSGMAMAQEPSARPAQGAAAAKPAGADAAFMKTAAMDGLAEVEHGRLAAQNAASAEVKQFGQRMVDDHSKANDELKSLAAQKQVTLPAELDPKHRAMQDKLAKLKGEAFDKAYMSHMVMAHQRAVTLFQQEAKSGKDPEAKAWAAKTLPVLQEHHKSARTLNGTKAKDTKAKEQ